jgi:hypothetical protein
MSLVKKQTMTPRKLAANRANAQFSRGPVTPEGKERMRAAHLRHGFYARAGVESLVALGEDPVEFQALVESLLDTWQPADAFEERLVMRLARSLWRLERSDRIQESFAVRQLSRHQGNMRFLGVHSQKTAAERLKALAAQVAREDYFTDRTQIELFEDFCRSVSKETPKMILALLQRLRKPEPEGPGAAPDGPPSPVTDQVGAGAEPRYGSGTPEADVVAPAEGPEREEARKRLLSLLSEEIRRCERAMSICRDAPPEPTSPYERDAMLAPMSPYTGIMLRIEESSFQQVWRLTTLLIKIQGRTKRVVPPRNEGSTRHVL